MTRRYWLEATPGQLQKLLGLTSDRPWQEYAACREVDPAIFHVEKGESSAPAKRICRGCPVRDECLEDALARGDRFGVWGGLSDRERRRLMAERDATTPGRAA